MVQKKQLKGFLDTMVKNEDNQLEFEFEQTVPLDHGRTYPFVDDCTKSKDPRHIYWGTSWGLNARFSEVSETTVSFTLQTAWTPPIQWALNCMELYQVEISLFFYVSHEFYGSMDVGNRVYNDFDLKDGMGYDPKTDSYYPIGAFKDFIDKHDLYLDSSYKQYSPP